MHRVFRHFLTVSLSRALAICLAQCRHSTVTGNCCHAIGQTVIGIFKAVNVVRSRHRISIDNGILHRDALTRNRHSVIGTPLLFFRDRTESNDRGTVCKVARITNTTVVRCIGNLAHLVYGVLVIALTVLENSSINATNFFLRLRSHYLTFFLLRLSYRLCLDLLLRLFCLNLFLDRIQSIQDRIGGSLRFRLLRSHFRLSFNLGRLLLLRLFFLFQIPNSLGNRVGLDFLCLLIGLHSARNITGTTKESTRKHINKRVFNSLTDFGSTVFRDSLACFNRKVIAQLIKRTLHRTSQESLADCTCATARHSASQSTFGTATSLRANGTIDDSASSRTDQVLKRVHAFCILFGKALRCIHEDIAKVCYVTGNVTGTLSA